VEAFFVVVTACVLLGLAVGALVAARRLPRLVQPDAQPPSSQPPSSQRRPGDD
jgi:cytochrome b561